MLSGKLIESAVTCAFTLLEKEFGGILETKSKVKQAELKQI